MNDRTLQRSPSRQSGVVLITGLIFMVILTMIVLATLRSGTLEERMAANARNRQLALQAAEAVLRDAEVALFNEAAPIAPFDPYNGASFSSACTNGYCVPATGTPHWKTIDWTSTAVTRSFAVVASNLTSTLIDSQPRYIVELMVAPHKPPGQPCTKAIYRLTARGVGKDGSEVIVQTMYRMLPNIGC